MDDMFEFWVERAAFGRLRHRLVLSGFDRACEHPARRSPPRRRRGVLSPSPHPRHGSGSARKSPASGSSLIATLAPALHQAFDRGKITPAAGAICRTISPSRFDDTMNLDLRRARRADAWSASATFEGSPAASEADGRQRHHGRRRSTSMPVTRRGDTADDLHHADPGDRPFGRQRFVICRFCATAYCGMISALIIAES